MQRVCALLRQQAPTLRVELAFLEFIPPDLRNCAEALVADGVQRVLVVPMFIARGGHLKRDLPLLLAELRQQHPGTIFDLADAVGEAETVVQAMAKHALSLLDA
mgnify:CR=1 FL=1